MKYSMTFEMSCSLHAKMLVELASIVCEKREIVDGETLWMFLQNMNDGLEFNKKGVSVLTGRIYAVPDEWSNVADFCDSISDRIRSALSLLPRE